MRLKKFELKQNTLYTYVYFLWYAEMTRLTKEKRRVRVAQRMRLKLEASSRWDCAANIDEEDSSSGACESSDSPAVTNIARTVRTGCSHNKRQDKVRAQQRLDKHHQTYATGASRSSSEDCSGDTIMSPEPTEHLEPPAMPRSASMQSMLLEMKNEFDEETRAYDNNRTRRNMRRAVLVNDEIDRFRPVTRRSL
jgi:hypothetical protein